jgi:hypothetical protein
MACVRFVRVSASFVGANINRPVRKMNAESVIDNKSIGLELNKWPVLGSYV